MPKRKHQFSPDGARYHTWTIGNLTLAFPAPVSDQYFYDYDEGERWVSWHHEYLTHTKGRLAGESLQLLPWLEIVTRELHGWLDKDTGFRRYMECFVAVPRKNSKTEWAAGEGLGMISIDGEPMAEGYILSSDEEQATLAFTAADLMIKAREDMQEMFEVMKSALSIRHPESGGILRVLPGRAVGLTGSNPSFLHIDEEHELKTDEAIRAVWSGTGIRQQRLKITTTTAGKDKTVGPCFKDWEYARRVRDLKEARDRFLPCIFEAPEDCNASDPRVWKMANPGYGQSVLQHNFEEMWLDALKNQAEMDSFKQFQLNMWVTRGSDFLPADRWDACYEEYTAESLEGMICYGGLDIASTQDMTALNLVFPFWRYEKRIDENGKEITVPVAWYRQLVWYWVPQAAVKISETTDWPYSKWGQENLEITGGEIADFGTIRKRIQALKRRFNLVSCAFDPKFSTEMVTALIAGQVEDGTIDEAVKIDMIKVAQSEGNMSPPTIRYRDLVTVGDMKHNGNKILAWNSRNAKCVTGKHGTVQVIKAVSAGKIDGLHGGILALGQAMLAPPPPPPAMQAEVW